MYWYLKVLKQYADVNGRARRKEYWWFFFFDTLIFLVLFIGTVALMDAIGENRGFVMFLPVALYFIGTLIPRIALKVRRLHDINISGWIVIISFIPLGDWVFLIMACVPGTIGANKYGPDPIPADPREDTY